jgi:GT2 family glycosyltransferase
VPYSVIISTGGQGELERTVGSLALSGADVVVAEQPGYRGYNAAARAAKLPNIAFVEAGTVLGPGTLDALEASLDDRVAIAGPVLCDESQHVVSAGRALTKTRMSRFVFRLVPRRAGDAYRSGADIEDVDAVSAACFMVPRSLFEELGGFDEQFADALADVDLSLRARMSGRRVVCVRSAFASVSSSHRSCDDPVCLPSAHARLDAAWRGRIAALLPPPHPSVRETRVGPERYGDLVATPRAITVFLHGSVAEPARVPQLFANAGYPISRVVWNSPDPPPPGAPFEIDRNETVAAARSAMELRGDRAIAFVDGRMTLHDGWLAALVREISWGADVVAATFVDEVPDDRVVPACDARASLVVLNDIPQHLRLDERSELDDALVDLTAKLRACGQAIRVADAAAFAPGIGRGRSSLDLKRDAPALRPDGLASIVMLSWNAQNYTRIALESIRSYTRHPHEIIIVDNGSGPETTDWLRTLDDVRVIYNASNRGFAGGNNQGIAAARGEYVVILNNDVVVTDGWLEAMIDGLRRNPLTGVTAPRSNKVAGIQLLPDANYPDVNSMHRYAAERRAAWRKTGFFVDRAIGFCLCIDRRVIDEIGGIDERFGAGNFEDDDFCIRVRAAGYKIYVCEDAFIHHFGSVTFAANKIDWQASMNENWVKFARKWGLPDQYPINGYLPAPVIARGFDRTTHYVALPAVDRAPDVEIDEAAPAAERRPAGVRFTSIVRNEADWSAVGAFVRRFGRAFDAEADVTLEIAACGTIDAATLGERVMRLLERSGLDADSVADIGIDDVSDVEAWLVQLRPAALLRVQGEPFGGSFDALEMVEETSPSALRRALLRWQSTA